MSPLFEHRVRRHDGQSRLCSVRALPILHADRTVREWVGVHTDITERKRDEDKLRELAADLAEANRPGVRSANPVTDIFNAPRCYK